MTDGKHSRPASAAARSLEEQLLRVGRELQPPAGAQNEGWARLGAIVGPGPSAVPTATTAASSVVAAATKSAAAPQSAALAHGAEGAVAVGSSSALGTTKLLIVAAKALCAGAVLGFGADMAAYGLLPTETTAPANATSASDTVVAFDRDRRQSGLDALARRSDPVDALEPSARALDLPAPLLVTPSAPPDANRASSMTARTRASAARGAPAPDSAPSPPKAGGPEHALTSGPAPEFAPQPATAALPLETAGPHSGAQPSTPEPGLLQQEALDLARAQREIERGRIAEAERVLALSNTRFENGALAQEREALSIKVLVLSGRRQLARRRAEAFLAAYPKSPLREEVRRLASDE